MKTITVYTKSVYGRLLTYPANTSQAIALQSLTGAKTLEFRHVKALQDLGFAIEYVQDTAARPAWLSPENVAALQRG